jgi:hypothetical protein
VKILSRPVCFDRGFLLPGKYRGGIWLKAKAVDAIKAGKDKLPVVKIGFNGKAPAVKTEGTKIKRIDGQPTTDYTNQQRNHSEERFVMVKKKPTETDLTNVLETTIELLQDAEIDEDDGMITVSGSVYMRLQAAVKEATGKVHGIEVSEDEEE